MLDDTPAAHRGREIRSGFVRRYKQQVAAAVARHLPEAGTLLDVGCDDGTTAALVGAERPGLEISGVDVQTLRPCRIPRTLYDGRTLPFPAAAFDAVMAIDVLHHTRHIDQLVREMARVARSLVVIKDHLVTGPFAWLAVAFGDAVTNLPYGIPCAYNFPTRAGWQATFAAAGLELVAFRDDLELERPCIRRFNPLFVLRPT